VPSLTGTVAQKVTAKYTGENTDEKKTQRGERAERKVELRYMEQTRTYVNKELYANVTSS
jgi:hypothetical protein